MAHLSAGRASGFPISPLLYKQKVPRKGESFIYAGVEGIGPSSQVLETRILPLNYTPKYSRILAEMEAKRV